MLTVLTTLLLSAPAHAKKDRTYTAVRVDLDGRPGLCSGEVQKLGLYGTDDKGKERKIRFGQWKAFQISWDIGPVSPKGALEMPLDPEPAWGKPGLVQVQSIDDPSVVATAQLPARYDCDLVLTREGAPGASGVAGERGSAEAESSGGPGQNGGNGQSGGNGPDLEVRVHLATDPVSGAEVLQVAVKDLSTGESWNSAVGAQGGHMAIRTVGGMGGAGGAGGEGGTAAPGYNGGNGGHGGNGGNGGNGGAITVLADAAAVPAMGVLEFLHPGGVAGLAGPGGAGGQGFEPGEPGQSGPAGHAGTEGAPGPETDVQIQPVGPIW